MPKLTLTDLASLTNEASALATMANNTAAIEAAVENTLSRDGTSPNAMNATLDMNSQRIINLPAPVSLSEPLRLADLTSINTSGGVPGAGAAGAILTKLSSTNLDTGWSTTLHTSTTVPAAAESATAYSVNLLDITNSGQQSTEGNIDSFNLFGVTTGFRVNYQSAGAGISQFPIQIGGLFATKATSIGQQLVGLNGTTYTNLPGGTTDSFWGVIGYVSAGPLASLNGIWGVDAEVAVSAGASVNYRVGVAASSLAPTQGSLIDAGFLVTAAVDKEATTAPWHNALVLYKSGAYAPIDQCVVTASGTFTAQYCIKLDTVTFANKIFDFGSTVFQLDGTGNATFGGSASFKTFTQLTYNANAPATMNITNTSTGTAATSSISIINNLDQSAFGLAGSNYTTVSQLANRAYIHSGPANNGIILDAGGSKPIDFYINNVRVGGFSAAGSLGLTQTADITLNQNAPTTFQILNNSTGTAATSSFSPSNNLDQAGFGLAGSNYTTITQLANRAYVHSGSANNGIILDAAGAKPIDFYINNARVGGFTTGGALTLTTPLAAGSGGTGLSALGTGVATALGINVGTAGAPVILNGAGGTPSSITLTNGSGLPTTALTGALQAAQEPAHTGDMTNTAGSLATTVVGINGVNQTTSWTSYSPTVTAQTPGVTPPTFTTTTGRYKQIGKTIICQGRAVVNVAGTGAGSMVFTLPTNARADNYVGSAFEGALGGKSGGAFIGGATLADATTVRMRDATAATFFANGADVSFTIVYETP